jgi:hypothetical protein
VSNPRLILALSLLIVLIGDARAAMAPSEISKTPGALVHDTLRPDTTGWTNVCSSRHFACVHAEPAVAAQAVEAAASLDRAWDMLTGALDYPAPDPDPSTGVYDLYLFDRPDVGRTFVSQRTWPSISDRASGFSFADGRLTGCMRDLELARQLARAIGLRLAPSADEASAIEEASYLARLAVPCAMPMVDGIDAFQKNSERPLVNGGNGGALFYWWLDDAFGRIPGGMVGAIWEEAPTKTEPGSDRWAGEPDGFDVLRKTFKGALQTGSTIDDLFAEFAVARALMGPIADDAHLLESQTLGDAARVRLDWDIEWPSAPRKLLSPRAVGPGGAVFIRVDRKGAAPGARLRIELEWENHARMKWLAVRLDANGREKSRVPVGIHDRTTEGNLTLTELDDSSAVLLVGMNGGDWVPFDPEDREWQPHGWIATLAQE